MEARLVDRAFVADHTAAFWFEPCDPFSFVPGQAVDITIPEPLYKDDAGTTRTFSIASLPNEKRLMVGTRLRGSAFKRSLMEAQFGSRVEIDGPFGSFTLHKNAAKPAVLLAGGIGVTPFRSIVGEAARLCLPHSITLVYSNRNASEVAWLSDFEEWQRRNERFRLVATLTAQTDDFVWSHDTGRVDAQFLRRRLDVSQFPATIFYLAGPSRFVNAMQALLPDLGADPDNIRAEEFPGY